MLINKQNIDTVRNSSKDFGPTGTLKIKSEPVDEISGIHERANMPEINIPPKPYLVKHEPKVIINDHITSDQSKLVELRGDLVRVEPLTERVKFDLGQIESDLKRVDEEISQAQKQAGSSDPEIRGLGFKRLTELGREKNKLTVQLPLARIDEFNAVDKEFIEKSDRYHALFSKRDRTPDEIKELQELEKNLPLLKAYRDQLKHLIEYRKKKNLSTTIEPKNMRQRLKQLFKKIFG